MQATLSLRRPLKVLDRIRDIYIVAADADFLKYLVEQLPRQANERQAFAIFLIAGLLADEHYRCMHRAATEDRLRRITVKRAPLALRCGANQVRQVTCGRQEVGDGGR